MVTEEKPNAQLLIFLLANFHSVGPYWVLYAKDNLFMVWSSFLGWSNLLHYQDMRAINLLMMKTI